MDALFGPLFGTSSVRTATDSRAWIVALAEVETALARACARVGLIELAEALEIGAAAQALSQLDADELGTSAVAGGNPVIPFVARLRDDVRRRGGERAAAAVHLGATSQDILDTAMMLVAGRALGTITALLAECADSCAALARAHRDTPMAGRTLMQQALPTTFGLLAAGWGAGLDRTLARLTAVRGELPVQLGGAAGTLSVLHPHGAAVRAALADELGLADPGCVWHTERSRITELAGALGSAAAAVAKVAGDIVLLAQSELGELREATPGGSSAMAHKQNPIAAVTARGAALQAPGFVVTLLHAAAPELQRGAGSWHAEWPALCGLLEVTGGAASRLRASLSGLDVDAAAMAEHLRLLADSVDVDDLGAAGELVDGYLDNRRR